MEYRPFATRIALGAAASAWAFIFATLLWRARSQSLSPPPTSCAAFVAHGARAYGRLLHAFSLDRNGLSIQGFLRQVFPSTASSDWPAVR
jgi:hypothetical protein